VSPATLDASALSIISVLSTDVMHLAKQVRRNEDAPDRLALQHRIKIKGSDRNENTA
jgi:hypothetical protein